MTDGCIRRMIKRMAWWRYAVDLWVTRKLMKWKGEKQYRLRGSCNRCGRCCEYPTIQMNEITFHLDMFRKGMIRWQTRVNGFRLHRENITDATLVFTCTHFDPETRLCDSYSSRPGICRDYPVSQIYGVNPTFFDACGYYAVDKRAESFRAALEKTGLPADKLEELFKRLHLKE